MTPRTRLPAKADWRLLLTLATALRSAVREDVARVLRRLEQDRREPGTPMLVTLERQQEEEERHGLS